MLGVGANHHFGSWIGKPEVAGRAEEIAKELPSSAWRRLSAGAGTKGGRLHDWAYLELADLDADEYGDGRTGSWTRGLLIRPPKNKAAGREAQPALVRWSIQESRRVAVRLAQQHIRPAHVIAWSLWRRAHQTLAQQAHVRRRMQLWC